ncbi:unnamed protein product [Arabidopsis thaliana]|uniref:(thale cress) hypothetical protein n=1 Tax=Arabidopsis thaliana TaxID=3702 RepID=A0A7G2EQH0_ARATH|nr:unnamed protein product [Arabidopsis thaliana]
MTSLPVILRLDQSYLKKRMTRSFSIYCLKRHRRIFNFRRLGCYTNQKRKYSGGSSSFTSLQTPLEEANYKIKEQKTLQAEREAEALQIASEQVST